MASDTHAANFGRQSNAAEGAELNIEEKNEHDGSNIEMETRAVTSMGPAEVGASPKAACQQGVTHGKPQEESEFVDVADCQQGTARKKKDSEELAGAACLPALPCNGGFENAHASTEVQTEDAEQIAAMAMPGTTLKTIASGGAPLPGDGDRVPAETLGRAVAAGEGGGGSSREEGPPSEGSKKAPEDEETFIRKWAQLKRVIGNLGQDSFTTHLHIAPRTRQRGNSQKIGRLDFPFTAGSVERITSKGGAGRGRGRVPRSKEGSQDRGRVVVASSRMPQRGWPKNVKRVGEGGRAKDGAAGGRGGGVEAEMKGRVGRRRDRVSIAGKEETEEEEKQLGRKESEDEGGRKIMQLEVKLESVLPEVKGQKKVEDAALALEAANKRQKGQNGGERGRKMKQALRILEDFRVGQELPAGTRVQTYLDGKRVHDAIVKDSDAQNVSIVWKGEEHQKAREECRVMALPEDITLLSTDFSPGTEWMGITPAQINASATQARRLGLKTPAQSRREEEKKKKREKRRGEEGVEKGRKRRVGQRVVVRGGEGSSESDEQEEKKRWEGRRGRVEGHAGGVGGVGGEPRMYGLRGLRGVKHKREGEEVLEEFEGAAELDEVMIPQMAAMKEDMVKFLAGEEKAEALITLYVLLKTPLTRKQIKETGLYKPVKDCARQEVNVNIRYHAKKVLKVWEDNHLLKYVEKS